MLSHGKTPRLSFFPQHFTGSEQSIKCKVFLEYSCWEFMDDSFYTKKRGTLQSSSLTYAMFSNGLDTQS
jgi:hypothetical protein